MNPNVFVQVKTLAIAGYSPARLGADSAFHPDAAAIVAGTSRTSNDPLATPPSTTWPVPQVVAPPSSCKPGLSFHRGNGNLAAPGSALLTNAKALHAISIARHLLGDLNYRMSMFGTFAISPAFTRWLVSMVALRSDGHAMTVPQATAVVQNLTTGIQPQIVTAPASVANFDYAQVTDMIFGTQLNGAVSYSPSLTPIWPSPIIDNPIGISFYDPFTDWVVDPDNPLLQAFMATEASNSINFSFYIDPALLANPQNGASDLYIKIPAHYGGATIYAHNTGEPVTVGVANTIDAGGYDGAYGMFVVPISALKTADYQNTITSAVGPTKITGLGNVGGTLGSNSVYLSTSVKASLNPITDIDPIYVNPSDVLSWGDIGMV